MLTNPDEYRQIAGVAGRRLRIAHITATFPPYMGGTGNVCFHNALEMARRGHDVHIFTAAHHQSGFSDPPELTVHRLKPLLRIGNAPLLPGLLQIKDFDLVHLHHPFIFGAELIWAVCRARGIPYVLTHHNDLIGTGLRYFIFAAYSKVSTRLVFGGARMLAAVSLDHARSSLAAPLFQQRWADVVEVPNGVNTALFRPHPDSREVRARWEVPPGAQVVLFVGALDRAHHYRRVDVLLQATKQLQTPNVHLVLVGDGDLREYYETLAEEMGIRNIVRFAGSVPQAELPPLYSAADVVVLPSQLQESFGLVAIEAMACGTPVVASNLPGVRTVVRDGETGLLATAGDPDDLRAKMDQLLANAPLRNQMGQAGRRQVIDRYSLQKVGDDLEALYFQAVGVQATTV